MTELVAIKNPVNTIRRAQSPKIAMDDGSWSWLGKMLTHCGCGVTISTRPCQCRILRFNFSRRSCAFWRQGFMAIGTQLWLLCLICSISLISVYGSKLERRELPSLSSTDITKLVTATDPLINLDPSNPSSHLSKILIPRAGMPLFLGHEFIWPKPRQRKHKIIPSSGTISYRLWKHSIGTLN